MRIREIGEGEERERIVGFDGGEVIWGRMVSYVR